MGTKKRKAKPVPMTGGMVVVQGRSKKDIKDEHEIKRLEEPYPTSPDGRVPFSPPELHDKAD